MQLLQSLPCTAPFTTGSATRSSLPRGNACRVQATRKVRNAAKGEEKTPTHMLSKLQLSQPEPLPKVKKSLESPLPLCLCR